MNHKGILDEYKLAFEKLKSDPRNEETVKKFISAFQRLEPDDVLQKFAVATLISEIHKTSGVFAVIALLHLLIKHGDPDLSRIAANSLDEILPKK